MTQVVRPGSVYRACAQTNSLFFALPAYLVDFCSRSVAEKYKPFHDMTSNQAIVLGELAKPAHQGIIPESAKAAVKLAKEDGITNEAIIAQLAVDFMVCPALLSPPSSHLLIHIATDGDSRCPRHSASRPDWLRPRTNPPQPRLQYCCNRRPRSTARPALRTRLCSARTRMYQDSIYNRRPPRMCDPRKSGRADPDARDDVFLCWSGGRGC